VLRRNWVSDKGSSPLAAHPAGPKKAEGDQKGALLDIRLYKQIILFIWDLLRIYYVIKGVGAQEKGNFLLKIGKMCYNTCLGNPFSLLLSPWRAPE
jgi:hypothetical protein